MKVKLLLARALLVATLAASVFALPAFRVEPIGPCSDPGLSDAVRAELSPEGFKVAGDAGLFCEIWLRKGIPLKPGGAGADYSALATGTFAGVIRYPAKGGDYRGQAVRVGTYTLRYQTIPQDGNHLGVSPTPDFFLLAPAAEDKDPNAIPEYAELIRLSKLAAGTNHPNPLHLATPAGGAPATRESDEGHTILELKGRAKGAGGETDFPIAIVLVGKAEG